METVEDQIKEIMSCIASLDVLMARVQVLQSEMEVWRKNPSKDCPASGPNAISFAEVRQLNLICKKVLDKAAPDLAENWYVSPLESLAGPEDIEALIHEQRVTLKHVLLRLGHAEVATPTKNDSADDKEIVLLKPSFFGMGVDLKALWKRVRKNNDGNGPPNK